MNYGDLRIPDRVWARVYPEPNTGCWLWGGCLNGNGYGTVTVAGETHGVHRLVKSTETPIASTMQVDHLCRVRSCCNPAHLRVVTPRTNVLAATGSVAQVNGAKTHCPADHPLSGPNLYVTRAGRRHCRECKRAAKRRFAAKQSEVAA